MNTVASGCWALWHGDITRLFVDYKASNKATGFAAID